MIGITRIADGNTLISVFTGSHGFHSPQETAKKVSQSVFLHSLYSWKHVSLSCHNNRLTMKGQENIVIADSLQHLKGKNYSFFCDDDCCNEYLVHALCTGGFCRFAFNGREFELREGDLMIVRKGKLIEWMQPSDGFKVKIIYITSDFISLCTPQSNYGTKGQIALFLNPVMHLTPEQQEVCRSDFRMVEQRLGDAGHHFRRDMLIAAVQMLILDFFDFHSHLYNETAISTQSAAIMNRFLSMLEDGTYRRHREVSYYADCLCVTPKYLSEVSKKVSGYAANYWINRYTALDIARLLKDKSLTFVNISDMFGFSSPAYFSRYVQRYLGMNPTEYRE